MSRRVLVSVDGLSSDDEARIRAVAARWGAEVGFLPESARWDGGLDGVEVAFGAPPVALLEGSQVRFLQLHSSGYDAYAAAGLERRGDLRIANARGVTAQAVAEQCMAMMFALARRIPFQVRNQVQHRWQRANSYGLLFGETVTVIGMGAIGGALAKMCHGIGMRVQSVQRSAELLPFVHRRFAMDELKDALRDSRHVVLALPAIALPRPLLGVEELDAMPDGSYVYSMSRASLLDYDALIKALDAGKLAGAGLDVFPVEPLREESPLWDREDVLIAPHSGGRFTGEMDALARLFADNLERYFADQALRNVVLSSERMRDK